MPQLSLGDAVPPRRQQLRPPLLLGHRSSRWLIVTTVCCALFADAFIYGIIVPIVPFYLPERCGVPEDKVEYWASTFLIVFGVAQLLGSPVVSWLADRIASRRPLLLLGLGLMGVATVLFYLATNVYILVVNRFLQGLSAAIVYSGGLALLVDTVGQAEIGQWMGLALSSANAALLVSPLVGGIVYAHAGYHAVFAVMLTLVGVDILLRLAVIEKGDAARWRERMRYGSTVEAPPASVRALNASAAADADAGIGAPHDVGKDAGRKQRAIRNGQPRSGRAAERQPLLGAPVAAAKPPPRRAESRLPPMLVLLRSPRLLTAVYGVFIETILVIGFDAVIPTFVKRTFGWDSSRAGLIFLTITVPSLAAPLVGRLSDRHGPRPVALTGFLLAGPTTAALALVDHESFRQIVLFCVLLTITGFGLVLMISPLAADISYMVDTMSKEQPDLLGDRDAYAQAFALLSAALSAGVVGGPAIAGPMYGALGWKWTAICLGLASMSAAIPVALFTGERRAKQTEEMDTVD